MHETQTIMRALGQMVWLRQDATILNPELRAVQQRAELVTIRAVDDGKSRAFPCYFVEAEINPGGADAFKVWEWVGIGDVTNIKPQAQPVDEYIESNDERLIRAQAELIKTQDVRIRKMTLQIADYEAAMKPIDQGAEYCIERGLPGDSGLYLVIDSDTMAHIRIPQDEDNGLQIKHLREVRRALQKWGAD